MAGVATQRYELLEVLESTKYFDLYSATRRKDSLQVRIKLFNCSNRDAKIMYSQESCNLTKLKKVANIVRKIENFEEIGSKKRIGWLVYEHPGESLVTLLEQGLTTSEKMFLFTEICTIVHQLFENNVAHMNILPESIFLQGGNIKLAAFHCSIRWRQYHSTISRNIDLPFDPYKAPEIGRDRSYHPYLADIWCMGILLHVMITESTPLFHEGEVILNAELPPSINDLILSLLDDNPKLRPPLSNLITKTISDEYCFNRPPPKKKPAAQKSSLTRAVSSRLLSFTARSNEKESA